MSDLPAPSPRRAYRVRSPELWAAVRAAWEGGEYPAAIERLFDVPISTTLNRAKREGWVRQAAADRPLLPEPAEVRPLSDPADIAEAALAQATVLLQRGRPAEAVALLKAADLVGGYAEYVGHLREELAEERAEAAVLRSKRSEAAALSPVAAAIPERVNPPDLT